MSRAQILKRIQALEAKVIDPENPGETFLGLARLLSRISEGETMDVKATAANLAKAHKGPFDPITAMIIRTHEECKALPRPAQERTHDEAETEQPRAEDPEPEATEWTVAPENLE